MLFIQGIISCMQFFVITVIIILLVILFFRRLIVKLEVTPSERLRTMNDMIHGVESRDVGPCGGFTTQYACMCDYHGLPYREEVAWVRLFVCSYLFMSLIFILFIAKCSALF